MFTKQNQLLMITAFLLFHYPHVLVNDRTAVSLCSMQRNPQNQLCGLLLSVSPNTYCFLIFYFWNYIDFLFFCPFRWTAPSAMPLPGTQVVGWCPAPDCGAAFPSWTAFVQHHVDQHLSKDQVCCYPHTAAKT